MKTRWYTRPVRFVADVQRALDFYLNRRGFVRSWHQGDGSGGVCQVNHGECEIILCQNQARRDRRWLLRSGCLVLAVTIAACSGPGTDGVCTASFAYLTVHAIDGTGQPVSGLAIRDSVLRTHQAFDVIDQSLAQFVPGTAVLLTDSNIAAVREAGDSVHVTGMTAGESFTANYIFGSDGCHVRKIAGPDTVVVLGR